MLACCHQAERHNWFPGASSCPVIVGCCLPSALWLLVLRLCSEGETSLRGFPALVTGLACCLPAPAHPQREGLGTRAPRPSFPAGLAAPEPGVPHTDLIATNTQANQLSVAGRIQPSHPTLTWRWDCTPSYAAHCIQACSTTPSAQLSDAGPRGKACNRGTQQLPVGLPWAWLFPSRVSRF